MSSPPSSHPERCGCTDALGLVVVRGEAMQRAGEERPGTMTALLGMDTDRATALCDEARGGDVLLVANENSPVQVVISGSVAAIERAEALAAKRKVRAVRLNVAGAFHSQLMEPAVEPILDALVDIEIGEPRLPVAENVSGTLVRDPGGAARAARPARGLAGALAGLRRGPGGRGRHHVPGSRPRRRADEDGETGRAGRHGGGRGHPRGCRRRGILGAVTRYATITGVGSSLPPRLVPNSWFESMVETNDEWIRDRTGIAARHFADEGTEASDLAVEAARARHGGGRCVSRSSWT